MRAIRFFADKRDYEEFVFGEIVGEALLREHPFYCRLIQFVLDAKAPLFYRQSDPSEHANFSAYYNFILMRETYTNPTLRAMYFVHDFAHMLFYYPHDVASVSRAEFEEALIVSEYAASNETEILIHYRVPALRERVFADKRIFVDLLRERGVAQPPVRALLHLRKQMIEDDVLDPFFFVDARDEPIRTTFKSYRGNRAWCKHRLSEVRALPNPAEYFYRFLTPTNYERVLAGYQSTATQASYESTVLMNVRLAFVLLNLPGPPGAFAECEAALRRLEEKVLVRSIAPEAE